jgi:hypothetical protein
MMAGTVWAQNPRIVNNGQHAAQAAKPGPGAQAERIHPAPGMAAQPHRRMAPHRQVVLRPTIVVPATVSKPAVAAGVTGPAGKGNDAAKPPKPEDKKWAMTGKRDPFFSPVVQAPTGSGCATGKKCLEIGQINVRGVVKSDAGYIAVVTNSLNKAYFLRENDPVFNGYVVRITGDTVVYQETIQDKLGKPMTHEVVKRLFTPAV